MTIGSSAQPLTLTVPEKLLRKLTRDAWFSNAGRARRSRAHTVWFDTGRFDLYGLGVTLSILEAGGHSIQRVSLPDSQEFLTAYQGGFQFGGIDSDKRRRQLDRAVRRGVSPLFEVSALARTWELHSPEGGPVSAKLTQGALVQAGRQHPFCELQLASDDADRCDHYLVARHFIAALGLKEQPLSGEDRGFELAGVRAPQPVLAGASPVAPGQSCAQALRAIAQDCLTQFLLNKGGRHHRLMQNTCTRCGSLCGDCDRR